MVLVSLFMRFFNIVIGKQYVLFLIGVACACLLSIEIQAMQYATPYKGNGGKAYGCATVGFAQAPTATMSSTSSFKIKTTSSAEVTTVNSGNNGYQNLAVASTRYTGNRGMSNQAGGITVSCITTSAKAIQGGVTTDETILIDNDDYGRTINPRRDPLPPGFVTSLDSNLATIFFLSMLAGAYALYKVRAQKKQEALA